MSEEKKKAGGWVEAAAARQFDPDAVAGTEWASFCAMATSVLQQNATTPLRVPIDPEAIADQGSPHKPWGLKEEQRLRLALMLLNFFERKDHNIREPGDEILSLLDAIETAERERRDVGKADITEAMERRAGNRMRADKKGKWEWLKKCGFGGFPRRTKRKQKPKGFLK